MGFCHWQEEKQKLEVVRDMLHVIGALCAARDLHTIAPWQLQRTRWRQFATQ